MEMFKMDSSACIHLAIALTLVPSCSAVTISPEAEVFLLEKKVEKLKKVTEMASQSYNETLMALDVAKRWMTATRDMVANSTPDMHEVMVKTTAEALRKAEKDSNKSRTKFALARIALQDAEERLEEAKKALKKFKSNASALLGKWLTMLSLLIVTVVA